MSYAVKSDWVADEVVQSVATSGRDISRYDAAVDRDVATEIAILGVNQSEVPKDVDGYYSSPICIKLSALYYKYHVFYGYWGSRTGDTDIYENKYMATLDEIRKFVSTLTPTMITGLTDDDGNSMGPRAAMKYIPIGGGAC